VLFICSVAEPHQFDKAPAIRLLRKKYPSLALTFFPRLIKYNIKKKCIHFDADSAPALAKEMMWLLAAPVLAPAPQHWSFANLIND
jgi:hypothetical protein